MEKAGGIDLEMSGGLIVVCSFTNDVFKFMEWKV